MPASPINLKNMKLACRMLELGVRPHLVSHVMAFPHHIITDWYVQITGQRPKRGQLRDGAASYVETRRDARRLSVFCAIYQDEKGTDTPSVEHLVTSIERFNKLYSWKRIDGTLAWMAVRDIDTGVLKFRYCSSCQLHYLYYLGRERLRTCSFCDSGNGRSF